MATAKASWGLEVGAYGIKAIRLERDGDAARMTDFAFIPHKKVLTSPDLDQDEMIRLSLGQFVSQKSVEGERVEREWREVTLLGVPPALEKSAVDKDSITGDREQVAGAGDLTCGAETFDLHP